MQPKPRIPISASAVPSGGQPARAAEGPAGAPPGYLIERLYALWIVTTAGLLVLIGLVWLLSSRSTATEPPNELAARIDELTARVAALERALELRGDRLGPASAEGGAAREAGDESASRSEPISASPAAPADSGGPLVAREMQWRGEFERALRSAGRTMYGLVDPDLARGLLAEVARSSGDADWGAATLERASLLAIALGESELADALAEKVQALKTVPTEYLRYRALDAVRSGETRLARECIRRLALETSGAASALLLRAELALATGDGAAAEDALSAYRGDERFTGDEAVRLGFVFVALERWSQLDRLLDMLVTLPPEFQGDVARLHAIRGAVDGAPAAIAALREALSEDPADREARSWLAIGLIREGKASDAAALLADPAFVGDADLQAARARAAMQLADDATAEASLQAALAASPQHPGALELSAVRALNRGELQAAADQLKIVIAKRPRRASTHFLLALVQARAGDTEAARAALTRAIELDPSYRDSAEQTELLAPLLGLIPTGATSNEAGTSPD